MRLHHTILHLTVIVVQHTFLLYFSRTPLCYFYINDDLVRTFNDNKKNKKSLPPLVKVKALLFSI